MKEKKFKIRRRGHYLIHSQVPIKYRSFEKNSIIKIVRGGLLILHTYSFSYSYECSKYPENLQGMWLA